MSESTFIPLSSPQLLKLGRGDAPPPETALSGGLPRIAEGPGRRPEQVPDAAVAAELVRLLETEPREAISFLMDRELCLVPARLARQLVEPAAQVRRRTNRRKECFLRAFEAGRHVVLPRSVVVIVYAVEVVGATPSWQI
jgi:hypothetical protein